MTSKMFLISREFMVKVIIIFVRCCSHHHVCSYSHDTIVGTQPHACLNCTIDWLNNLCKLDSESHSLFFSYHDDVGLCHSALSCFFLNVSLFVLHFSWLFCVYL